MYTFLEDYANKKAGSVHRLDRVLAGRLKKAGIVEPFESSSSDNKKSAKPSSDKSVKASSISNKSAEGKK